MLWLLIKLGMELMTPKQPREKNVTFWKFCCCCVIFFQSSKFSPPYVKAEKEQHVIISKHRREDIFVDNYFVCADARVKRVRGEIYTSNPGVCLSVSTSWPMILKLWMHNPHLKSMISNKCLFGKSVFPNFSTFFAIEARYCRRRRKCILMQK